MLQHRKQLRKDKSPMPLFSRVSNALSTGKTITTANPSAVRTKPKEEDLRHGKLGEHGLLAGGEKNKRKRIFKKKKSLEEKAERRLNRAWGKGKLTSKSIGGTGLYRQNSLTDIPAAAGDEESRRTPARVLEKEAQTPLFRRRTGWESPARSSPQPEKKTGEIAALDIPRSHVLRRANSYEQALEAQNALFATTSLTPAATAISTGLRRTDSYAEALADSDTVSLPAAPPPATKTVNEAMTSLAGLPSHAMGAEIASLGGREQGGVSDAERLDLQAARSYMNVLEGDSEHMRSIAQRVENGSATPAERKELSQLLRNHMDALGGIQRRLDEMLTAHMERGALSNEAVETEAVLRSLGNMLAEEHMALADLSTHLSDLLPETRAGNMLDRINSGILDIRGARHAINERYQAVRLANDPQTLLEDKSVQKLESLALELDERAASMESQGRALAGRAREGELIHLLRAPEDNVDELAQAQTRLSEIFPDIPSLQWRSSLQRGRSLAVAQQPWQIIDLEIAAPADVAERLGEVRSRIIPGKHLSSGAQDSYVVAGEPVNGLPSSDVNRYLGVPNLALSDLTVGANSQNEQNAFISLRHGFFDAPVLQDENFRALPDAVREQVAADLAPHAGDSNESRTDAAAFSMAKDLAATQLNLDGDLRARALAGEVVDLPLYSLAFLNGGKNADAKSSREVWNRQRRALEKLENNGEPVRLALSVDGKKKDVRAKVSVLQAGFVEDTSRSHRGYRMVESDALMNTLVGSKRQREIGGKAATEMARIDREMETLERELRWRVDHNGRHSRFAEMSYGQLQANLQERRRLRAEIAQLSREVKNGWQNGISNAGRIESYPARVSLLLSLTGELPVLSSRDGLSRVGEVDAATKHLAMASSAQQEIPALENTGSQWHRRGISTGLGRESEALDRLNRGLPANLLP